MKMPQIDETKLPEAEALIDQAARLMEERDCDADKEAKRELRDLQRRLRELTGNQKLRITAFRKYWAATDLRTMARLVLQQPPQKSGLTDDQLREIYRRISKLDFDVPKEKLEATLDYYIKVLKVETGLNNITDYIYYPELVGAKGDDDDTIMERILNDRK